MVNKVINNDFSDIVYGRRSIRKYNEDVKISEEEMTQIIQDSTRAPSAVNLQSWRFVVVQSDEGKDTLRPFVKGNTKQNDTSAAMVIILGDLQCEELGEDIYSQAVDAGGMTTEEKDEFLGRITPIYQNFSEDKMNEVVTIDASLVAMQLMFVARSRGYDTCAITGFTPEGLVKAFNMDETRYRPVMIVSIGEADESGFETVRLDADKITTFK